MFSVKSLVALSFLSTLTLATPLERRADPATTCASDKYTSSQVTSAANAACSYLQEGGEAGSSYYPEHYNNYEGFNFPVPSPWYEFPILESGVYNGGEPGADRVVINENCEFAGAITHTGASGDDFVGCSGTST